MTLLTIMPDEDLENASEHPVPGKSTILFQLIEGDSYYASGLEIYECQGEGGSWDLEGVSGTQEDVIAHMLQNLPDGYTAKVGWHVIEGFYGFFHCYDGENGREYDCDYEFDAIRAATDDDLKRFGLADLQYKNDPQAGQF